MNQQRNPRVAHRAFVSLASWLALLPCLANLTACGASQQPPVLPTSAAAVLQPGVGVGALRLGETTLLSFLQQHGSGQPATMIADDAAAIELSFPQEQLHLVFALTPECTIALGSALRSVATLLNDPAAFSAEYPSCTGSALSSIAIAADGSDSLPRCCAVADEQVRLLMPRAELLAARGISTASLPAFLAGTGPDEARYEPLAWHDGLVAHVGRAIDADSSSPLVVRRLALFAPVQP
jgi:hypothetical protein